MRLQPVLWTGRTGVAATTLMLGLLAAPGTGVRTPGLTRAGLSYPLDGIHSEADFEQRTLAGGCWLAGLPGFPRYNGRNVHAGIDLRADQGDPIYAVGPGIVDPCSDTVHRGYGPGWSPGYAVVVRGTEDGGGRYCIVYGHTQNHRVHGGDAVAAGQPLAEVGPWLPEDGGPHLHLTVRLGDLPTQGWGTPTMGPTTPQSGAESAMAPLDVVSLGYRDPRSLLRGETNLELLVGTASDGTRYPQLLLRYLAGYHPTEPAGATGGAVANALGLPSAGAGRPSDRVERSGDGVLQAFRGENGDAGALLLRNGAPHAIWVHGPIWDAYLKRGGPTRFGYPSAEEQVVGGVRVQQFAGAVIVWDPLTGVAIVPD